MTRLVNNDYTALAAKIGREAGKKIAARVSKPATFRAPAPLTFKGNLPLASDLTDDEARALAANIELIGQYVNEIDYQLALGVDLYGYATNEMVNGTSEVIPSDELLRALKKQSQAFDDARMAGSVG